MPSGDDQPGLLGDPDELRGREQAAAGVVPADQRLEPGDRLGGQVHRRLVVQHQLVGARSPAGARSAGRQQVHRRARAGSGRRPRGCPCRASLARYIAASALRSSSLSADLARYGGRDPDAGPHRVGDALEHDRLGQGGEQPLGDPAGGRLVAALQQHRELVAAEPGRGVVLAQGSPRAAAATAISSRSPTLVAQAVVDELEVVQVAGTARPARTPARRAGPGRAPAGRRTAGGWPAR